MDRTSWLRKNIELPSTLGLLLDEHGGPNMVVCEVTSRDCRGLMQGLAARRPSPATAAPAPGFTCGPLKAWFGPVATV